MSSFDDADGGKADTGAGYWMYGAGVRIPAGKKGVVDLAFSGASVGPEPLRLPSYPRMRNNDHFTGTSRFNVSAQFCATIAAGEAASPSTGRRIITNRPSGITSYVRQPVN